MNPKLSEVIEEDYILKFTLSGINVSLANALRRIILSEIPTLAFKTEFHSENTCNIEVNTSRLHNEILRHRLGCIPIHEKVPLNKNESDPLTGKYILELDITNDTDNIMYVTTEQFKIKNKLIDSYLTEEETRRIFPKNVLTQSYIDFARLRPKISDKIPGEQIKLTCDFSISNAKENSMYNVVSKCSYSNTIDTIKKNEVWEKYRSEIELTQGITKEEMEFQKKNFELLDAQRYYKDDSFDFVVQTVGVYENADIVKRGCVILQHKFIDFISNIDSDNVPIIQSESTIDNCYDVVLEDEDYTMGKVIEFILYDTFYNKEKKISYCGFKKFHPHDTESIIRVALIDKMDKTEVKQLMRTACVMAQDVFTKIYSFF